MKNADPQDIIFALRKSGTTLTAVARLHGVHANTMRSALIRRQPRQNRQIAEALGRSVHDLWPEWFDEAGRSIQKLRHDLPRAAAAPREAA